jgi:uncharacterized repeat protein (TIGR01451 family)
VTKAGLCAGQTSWAALPDGTYYAEGYVEDAAANSVTTAAPRAMLQCDSTVPQVSISTAGGYTTSTWITLTGQATDAGAGLAATQSVSVSKGSSMLGYALVEGISPNDRSWTYSTTNITLGLNTFRVCARDIAGNLLTACPAVTLTATTDLATSITVTPVQRVLPGDTLTYTVVVSNLGPLASSVVMTDNLPAGVARKGRIPSSGFICNLPMGNAPLVCTQTNMLPGQHATVDIAMTVISPVGSIVNTVVVAGTPFETDYGNNSASVTTAITPKADLSVVKTALPATVGIGQRLTYTLLINNIGPSNAAFITVVDQLPAVGVVSVDGCDLLNGTVTCTIPALSAGAAQTFTLVVTAPNAGGFITNTATATSAIVDTAMANNTAVLKTLVTDPSQANLSLSMTAFPEPVGAGRLLTYTVTVENGGPSAGRNVVITNLLPLEVNFASASPGCVNNGNKVVCTVSSDLPLNTSATFTTAVTVPAAVPANGFLIFNTVVVTASTSDPDVSDNTAFKSVWVRQPPIADVSVTQSGPAQAAPGQLIRYTLAVSNAGPDGVDAFTLRNQLPVGFALSAMSAGWSCGGAQCVYNGSLPAGQSLGLALTGTVTATTGILTTTADVSSVGTDPDSSNNQAIVETTIVSAGVALGKVGPVAVKPGQQFAYTLVVTNFSVWAANVILTDVLPANLTYVQANGSGWGCTQGTATQIVCTFGNLGAGESSSVDLVVQHALVGSLVFTNVATVTSDQVDTDLSNNTATWTTQGTALVDLSVQKVGPPAPAFAGTTLAYTVTVTNGGPDAATGVTLSDIMPQGMMYVNGVSAQPQGACSSPGVNSMAVTCTLPLLAPGASWQVRLDVMAVSGSGTITNTACASSNDFDANTGNDCGSVSTEVFDGNLAVLKSVSAPAVHFNERLVWTIALVNGGGAGTAGAVNVTDTLPAGFQLTAATPGYSQVGRALVWSLPIPPGTTALTVTGVMTPLYGITASYTAVNTGTYRYASTSGVFHSAAVTVGARLAFMPKVIKP